MPHGGQASKRCHVHWLPTELLFMIFLLCHDMDPRPQIVLACKWWLNVARYYKLLWIDIDLHKPEQALRRMMWAQGAPLEVRFAPPYAPRDDPVVFLRALRKAWPKLRTKSIRILELDRDMPTLARSIPVIAKSSSTLECLSISPSQSEEDELFSANGRLPPLEIAHTVLELSDAVLAAKFPRLKRLELADCTGSWTSDLYRSPNLRILKIQMSEDVTFPAVPFDEVMATICSLVSLSELSLIGCLPPLAGLCPHGGTTVHGVANLRALETLVLRSTPDRCMLLMRHLQYPPTCRLFITCSRPAQNGVARYLIGRTVEPSMYAYRVVVDQDKIVVDASKDQDGLSWTRNLQLALTVGALPPQQSALISITDALLSVRASMLSLIPAHTVYFPSIVQNVCMHTTATVLHLDWSKTNRYALHDALIETAFAFRQGVFPHLKVLIMDQLNLRIPVLLPHVLPDPRWYERYDAEKAALAMLGGELAKRHGREENKFGTLKFVSCVGFQPGAWATTLPMKWLGEEGVGEIERWAQRMEEL